MAARVPRIDYGSLGRAYWDYYLHVRLETDPRIWNGFKRLNKHLIALWNFPFDKTLRAPMNEEWSQQTSPVPFQELALKIMDEDGLPSRTIRACIQNLQPFPPRSSDSSAPVYILKFGMEGLVIIDEAKLNVRKILPLAKKSNLTQPGMKFTPRGDGSFTRARTISDNNPVVGLSLRPPEAARNAEGEDSVGLRAADGTIDDLKRRYNLGQRVPGFLAGEVTVFDEFIEVRMPRRHFEDLTEDALRQWTASNRGVKIRTVRLSGSFINENPMEMMLHDPETKGFFIAADLNPNNFCWNADRTSLQCADALHLPLTDDDFIRVLGLRLALHEWVDKYNSGTGNETDLLPSLRELEAMTRPLDQITWHANADAEDNLFAPIFVDATDSQFPLRIIVDGQTFKLLTPQPGEHESLQRQIIANSDRVYYADARSEDLKIMLLFHRGTTHIAHSGFTLVAPAKSMPLTEWGQSSGPLPTFYPRGRNVSANPSAVESIENSAAPALPIADRDRSRDYG
jgi:hypothetical protein